MGRLGGSVGWVSDFSLGHDLAVCEFEPRIGLCAEHRLGAWSLLQILCVSLSLLLCLCCLSLKIINIFKKSFKGYY